MGETKAKYHHLIPRTYLSAWEWYFIYVFLRTKKV